MFKRSLEVCMLMWLLLLPELLSYWILSFFYCIMENYYSFIFHRIFWWTESLYKFVVHNAKSQTKGYIAVHSIQGARMGKCAIVYCLFWQGKRMVVGPFKTGGGPKGGPGSPPREVLCFSDTLPHPLPQDPHSPRDCVCLLPACWDSSGMCVPSLGSASPGLRVGSGGLHWGPAALMGLKAPFGGPGGGVGGEQSIRAWPPSSGSPLAPQPRTPAPFWSSVSHILIFVYLQSVICGIYLVVNNASFWQVPFFWAALF